LNTVVVGISADKLEDQVKFTEKENLNYPLLADPDKKVIKELGALNEKGTYANRYTFVIDKSGTIVKIYKTVKPMDHPEELLKFIAENLEKK
jgi:peroxiredoxin Q/BCP